MSESNLYKIQSNPLTPHITLLIVSLLILLSTVAPTIYTTDSPELVTAAKTLGIPHAPGYPLYILIAHVFTWLPFDDVAYRVNLFSVICLAGSVPLLYGSVKYLINDKAIAVSTAFIFLFSYYIWTTGIVAEVYAPQLFALSACALILAKIYTGDQRLRTLLLLGLLFGLAVALNPSSIFFAPGLVIALLLMRIPLRMCIYAGILSLLVFGLSLLYFPMRESAAFNAAGEYNAQGMYERVDLHTLSGVWWHISGRQFDSFFFADGYIPSVKQWRETLTLFWGNFIGVGLLLGLAGAYRVARYERGTGLVIAWLVFFLPYTCFYITYGADDRETMFGPAYLIWSILIAFGLAWAADEFAGWVRYAVIFALPVLLFVVNLPLVDVSSDTGFRDHAEAVLQPIPENAAVFGYWGDVVPIQFLHIVENQRSDLTLYNLFFFDYDIDKLKPCVDSLMDAGRPVVFLDTSGYDMLRGGSYNFEVIATDTSDPQKPEIQSVLIQRIAP